MSHSIIKVPIPKGWEDLIVMRSNGRPSPDHLTCKEFAAMRNCQERRARDILNKMVIEGKLVEVYALHNSRNTKFFAPKK